MSVLQNPVVASIPGLQQVTITEAFLPKDSVLRKLTSFSGVDDYDGTVTHIRVDPSIPNTPTLQQWFTASRGEPWEIHFRRSGTPLSLQVRPHSLPSMRTAGWLTVQATTKGLLIHHRHMTSPYSIVRWLHVTFTASTCPAGPVKTAATDLKDSIQRIANGTSDSPGTAITQLVSGPTPIIMEVARNGLSFLSATRTQLEVLHPFAFRQCETILRRLVANWNTYTSNRAQYTTIVPALLALEELQKAWRYLFFLMHHKVLAQSRTFRLPDYDVIASQVNAQLSSFYGAIEATTSNSDVRGALLESRLRNLVARWVRPLSLSTGGVAGLLTDYQVDGMIWDHHFCPPLIEEGDTALVAPSSLRGMFEIKASCPSVPEFAARMVRIQSEVLAHRQTFEEESTTLPTLGIILFDKGDYETIRSRSMGYLTCLFQRRKNEEPVPNPGAVLDIVRFVYDQVLPYAYTEEPVR
jgi:hypothetical protein